MVSRRDFLKRCAAGTAVSALGGQLHAAESDKPNVVIFYADDLGWGGIGPNGQAARKAFHRRLVSLTDEKREAFKRRLLELGPREVLEAAGKYFTEADQGAGIAVISNEEKVKAANERLAGEALELHAI